MASLAKDAIPHALKSEMLNCFQQQHATRNKDCGRSQLVHWLSKITAVAYYCESRVSVGHLADSRVVAILT